MFLVPHANPGELIRYPSAELTDFRQSNVSTTSWSETSVNFGQARGISRVVVGLYGVSTSGTADISTISVGSDSSPVEVADRNVTNVSGASFRAWLFVANPNTEIGSISITYPISISIHGLAVWRLNSLLSATPFHTNSVGVESGNAATTLNIPERGCAIGFGGLRISGNYYHSGAHENKLSAQTGRTISVNNVSTDWQWVGLTEDYQQSIGSTGSQSQRVMVCASWA
jgi:hypothetical protein